MFKMYNVHCFYLQFSFVYSGPPIKKIDSPNVPNQIHDIECELCAQTQENYTSLKHLYVLNQS